MRPVMRSPDVLDDRAATVPPVQPMPATAAPIPRVVSSMPGPIPVSPGPPMPPNMRPMPPPTSGMFDGQMPPPGAIPVNPDFDTGPGIGSSAGYRTYRPAPFDRVGLGGDIPPYASGALGAEGLGPAGGLPTRPNLRKNVSFQAGGGGGFHAETSRLNRDRSEEERRGEGEAGVDPGPRDIK